MVLFWESFAWISAGIMLILFKVIKFGKKWVFSGLLGDDAFGTLGLIPVFTMIFSNQIELDA